MSEKSVNIGIVSIHEIEFMNRKLPPYISENFDRDKLKFSLNFNFDWSLKDEMFSIITSISFAYPIENEKLFIFTQLKNVISYSISDLAKVMEIDEDNNFKMDDNLLETLVGLALSTTRGMFYSKTLGTFVNQFYLPILNPKELLQNLNPVRQQ